MIVYPNAKINLGLNVLEKRPDGFHNIETVFYPVALCDILEIIPSAGSETTLAMTGLPVEGDPAQNLCLKAYRMLKEDFGLPPVSIHLHKVIPTGAGLGGGSSDAAFTLKLLSELFVPGLDQERMTSYARRLGSDCAFFLVNRPVLATGKGDVFEPVAIDLAGYTLVILKPSFGISTSAAYSMITPSAGVSPNTIVSRKVNTWKELLVNRFESPVFDRHPQIAALRDYLYETGAVYASMSGSGSAVFGIFEKPVTLNPNNRNFMVQLPL